MTRKGLREGKGEGRICHICGIMWAAQGPHTCSLAALSFKLFTGREPLQRSRKLRYNVPLNIAHSLQSKRYTFLGFPVITSGPYCL